MMCMGSKCEDVVARSNDGLGLSALLPLDVSATANGEYGALGSETTCDGEPGLAGAGRLTPETICRCVGGTLLGEVARPSVGGSAGLRAPPWPASSSGMSLNVTAAGGSTPGSCATPGCCDAVTLAAVAGVGPAVKEGQAVFLEKALARSQIWGWG